MNSPNPLKPPTRKLMEEREDMVSSVLKELRKLDNLSVVAVATKVPLAELQEFKDGGRWISPMKLRDVYYYFSEPQNRVVR